MLRGTKLKVALAKIELIAVHGPWSRTIKFHHLLKAPGGRNGRPQPLWGGASKIIEARFTPKDAFDSIYLADHPVTALIEVQALVVVPGSNLPLRAPPWTLVTVDGIVSDVLDLTSPPILKALGTNEQEMTGSWAKAIGLATQELGRAAYDSNRISAIRYGSAKCPGGTNLVVFSDHLAVSSSDYLEVFDPHANLKQRIGL